MVSSISTFALNALTLKYKSAGFFLVRGEVFFCVGMMGADAKNVGRTASEYSENFTEPPGNLAG